VSSSSLAQGPILAPAGRLGCAHVFELAHGGADPRAALSALRGALAVTRSIAGLGPQLCALLDRNYAWLRPFPALSGPGVAVPSTQGALFCLLLGDDRGELLHESRALCRSLASSFELVERTDTFVYRDGRDLTGYVDGTENPKDERAITAALIAGRGPGLDGGSILCLQRWVHDLDAFERFSPAQRDALIGRSAETNDELGDAPASAHVKRSAQESFEPDAFMVRRSMPFSGEREHGLYFLAFCESIERYERVLRRMLGLEDGIVDGLFAFSRAISGGYYFCPPIATGKLDLRALGV
jgi:putative iron-dependent peroxidase